jgi:hypothetical protein
MLESTEEENNELWEYFNKKKEKCLHKGNEINLLAEIKRYEDLDPIQRDNCPLEWWATEGQQFPSLKILARKFLARPATSVPAKRLFSKSGEILSARRSVLKPEMVDKLVFLSFNCA